MLIQGQIGQITGQDGGQPNLRQGRTGELVVSQNHGRYYEAASRGNIFNLSLTAATTGVSAGNLVAAAAAAATQFAIWNPVGSGVNLSILKTHIGIISGTIVGGPIFHGYMNGTVPSIQTTYDAGRGAQNALIGGRVPVARYVNTAASSGTTLTGGIAPLIHKPMNLQYSAGTYAALGGSIMMDLVDGDIVIPPGYGWLPLFATAGTSVLFSASCTWEEVPI